MRTAPITTRADTAVSLLLAEAATGTEESASTILQSPALDRAVWAVRNGNGLLQTAAGPGGSVRLVRALLRRYGPAIARPHPVRLSAARELTAVEAPLATLPPLVVAAGYGCVEVVRCLVEEFGHDPAGPAVSGLTPMLAAMQRKQYAVVQYLRSRVSPSAEEPIASCMPTSSPIAMAAWLRDPQLIGLVGGSAAEWSGYYVVNDDSLGTGIQAPECASPLVIALYRGHAVKATDEAINNAVVAMVRRGAAVSAPGRYSRRLPHAHLSTPLQCAIDFGLPACVRTLLLARADPTASLGGVANVDCVPLVRAVRVGSVETVQLLLLAAGGVWGTGTQRFAAWRASTVNPAMRSLVDETLRMPPGEQLLERCDPDPAMRRLAITAERRSLAELWRRRAYSTTFLRRWFVWSPRAHAVFPAADRRTARAVLLAYGCVQARDGRTPAARLWRRLPPELLLHILSFLARSATPTGAVLYPQ